MIRRLVSRAYYASKPAWEIYRSLLQTQFLACDELDQLQLHKLQRMIEHAGTVSPFWRTRFEKCGISTGSVDSLATLQRLPILEKEQLRTLVAEYGTDTARWVQKRSGGSTGKPITTYASPGHLYWSMASMLRFYSWIGYRSGDPRAKLFAMPTRMGIPEHTPFGRIRNWLSNTLYLDALNLTPERVEAIIAALRSFQPRMLIGYTSAMAIVARALAKNGRTLCVPGIVIVNSAEALDPIRRDIIQSGLGGLVFDHYGTRDVGHVADECEQRNGLHVHMEYLIVEIVDQDGKWARDGEEGEILITELENHGVPLFRYRIGDRAIKAQEPCSCGRGLQLLQTITGRSTDIIKLPNGNKLTGLVFPHIFKDFPIVEYQVVQKDLEHVAVKLVLEQRVATAEAIRSIENALVQRMPGVVVTVTVVEAIPRSPSGKLRSVISELECDRVGWFCD